MSVYCFFAQFFQNHTVGQGFGSRLQAVIDADITNGKTLPIHRADGNGEIIWIYLCQLWNVSGDIPIIVLLYFLVYRRNFFAKIRKVRNGYFARQGLADDVCCSNYFFEFVMLDKTPSVLVRGNIIQNDTRCFQSTVILENAYFGESFEEVLC